MAGETNGPTLLAASWVLAIVSFLLLALRFYCKLSRGRPLWWDDYTLSVSWICLFGTAIAASLSVHYGLGRRTAELIQTGPENLTKISKLSIPGSLLVVLATVWSKTSFAITVMRICDGRKRAFLWFAIISMNVLMITTGILLVVVCAPLEMMVIAAGGPQKKCLPPKVNIIFGTIASAYSGVMDVLLAILPWHLVWRLQMKIGEKIGVAFAMSMGVFAGATAFIKCTYIRKLGSGDISFEISYLMIWGAAEAAVTIVAASIPILRVLIRDATTQYYYGSRTHTQKGVRPEDESGILGLDLRGEQSIAIHSSSSAHPSSRRELENDSIASSDDDKTTQPNIHGGGIVRTTHVTVETKTIGTEGTSGYELDNLRG